MRTAVLAACALAACALAACHRDRGVAVSDEPARNPLAHSRQLVTAVIDDWHATHTTLRLWQRERIDAPWQPIGEPWSGVIGRAGAAWPRDRHEGDGTSPAGAFPLDRAFGYAAAPPPTTKLSYTQTDASWRCVDDVRSPHYAQIVDTRQTPVDWTSDEAMYRDDALYTWVVEVEYNREHTPNVGSCIFLHVWRNPDTPTVGCTAMPEADLTRVIAALDPTARPMFVLLPRAEYDAHAAGWGLPPR